MKKRKRPKKNGKYRMSRSELYEMLYGDDQLNFSYRYQNMRRRRRSRENKPEWV